jgi:hypothetical protein
MIAARIPTKIACCLTLAAALTLSSEFVQLLFLGLLMAMLFGLWRRGSGEMATLPVVAAGLNYTVIAPPDRSVRNRSKS